MKNKMKKWHIVGLGVSLVGTATGAVLLGLGTNATYSIDEYNKVGIGSLNYGWSWYDGVKQWDDPEISYWTLISNIKANRSRWENDPVLSIQFNKMLDAYNLMVSGAILTSIFSISIIIFTILLFISNKKSN